MPNIKDSLREEFYETFTTSSKQQIADFWLSKRDTELKTLLVKVEERKRDKVTGGFEGENEMNIEIATYNEALTDISNIIKTLIGESHAN
jgi:hypothetical protein